MAKAYNFDNYEKDTLTKPRDKAWGNWAKFENVGDKVQGYIRDAFYRPAEGLFKDQRGITLEQQDGTLINVGIKRLPFILDKTDNLRIGDPLTIVLEKEKPSQTKGFSATKEFAFYGTNLPENAGNPTVKQMDSSDEAEGGSTAPDQNDSSDSAPEASPDDIPFGEPVK